MDINLLEVLAKGFPMFLAFLFSLCFHEYAHGWVAKQLGDRTAELQGRLTLNPMAHADMMGTFILPIVAIFGGGALFGSGAFFGWAKPVPVNSRNLANEKRDMFWIAIAGPLSNLFLAIVSLFTLTVIEMFFREASWAAMAKEFMAPFVMINMFLCVFNLLPFHPLDGGKVMARFLPEPANRWLEDNQNHLNMALIVLFIVGGFRFLSIPVYWLLGLIQSASIALLHLFA